MWPAKKEMAAFLRLDFEFPEGFEGWFVSTKLPPFTLSVMVLWLCVTHKSLLSVTQTSNTFEEKEN